MAAFEIRKKTSTIWEHNIPGSPLQDLILSAGYFSLDDLDYTLFSKSGGTLRESKLSEITVFDDTDVSAPETFITALALFTRLTILSYPYFLTEGALVGIGFTTLSIINVPTEESANINKNVRFILDATGGALSLIVDTSIVTYFELLDKNNTITDINTVTLNFGTDSLLLQAVDAEKWFRIIKDPAGLKYNVYNNVGKVIQTLNI